MEPQAEQNQKPSARMDRSTLGSWIFALLLLLTIESCVLGVVVVMWMIASGYLF